MKTLKLRQSKRLVQQHMTNKWLNQDLNPCLHYLKDWALSTLPGCPLFPGKEKRLGGYFDYIGFMLLASKEVMFLPRRN